ncbi:alpha-1,6-mannosyl-glycoprotein 2-beta-N-acetylglucosaminyltransferase-like [Ylistrum balloti]|uniref:alpha-1,6-mannosyl-glycoprotein 2-beta-N-acetylglucosaminyltransferase-like n=1 Tax=Ylistrum balloti TaxID=509963 RepID=UPI002905B4AE|nr:alpha-1,6-mannosyl-glycoprotein 2-beta-N-acetylglucosaminyltransferase-like [Ylistrum balloti]
MYKKKKRTNPSALVALGEMKVRPTRLIRTLFMVILVLFVFLNMHVLMHFEPRNGDEINRSLLHKLRLQGNWGDTAHVQTRLSDLSDTKNTNDSGGLEVFIPVNQYNKTFLHRDIEESNLTQIRLEVDRANREQFIHNLNKFGLKLKSDSVVIVVQVHDRSQYLQILIDSLRKVNQIKDSLLIFSHDVYSDELNRIVRSVDFCPVMQIYFPVTLQLHPKEFPGQDPNDCPRDVKKEEALKKKCNNAAFPDKYGHYREPKYCQTKHHWLWKLDRVFDKLEVMKNYTGHVLLLEEDYYVAPDIITVIQMMNNLKKRDCKECRMLTAGNYDKTQSFVVNSGKVELATFISSRHNMGMTFARDLWNEIKKCAKEFCDFDDYNWDWTLQHLSMKCIANKVQVMKMKATRVFHMGDCGVHHKGKKCEPLVKQKQIEKILQDNQQHLNPNVMKVAGTSKIKIRDPKPNGGWGDIRDKKLCHSFVSAEDERKMQQFMKSNDISLLTR